MTSTIRQALAVAVAARVPVLLWGGPGVGKTSAIREMAAAAGLPCEAVIASIREPSDFAGLPVVAADGASVQFAPPRWAERLARAGRGLLFLDELSTAPPAVQAALLRVVLERTVGDLELPEEVTIVAAANPPEQAADGWDLSAPLSNRFCHLDWSLTAEEWSGGVLAGFAQAEIGELDRDALNRVRPGHLGTIGAFVRARPHLFSALPDSGAGAGRAWPSPRSWNMAAELLAACEVLAAGAPVAAALTIGSVGVVAGGEFLAWRDDLGLPDPEAVLADPLSFRLPERGDRAYAALAAVTAAVVAENSPARWVAAWTAIGAATAEAHADVAVAAVRTLIAHRPAGAVPPREVLVAMAPLLRTAGLFDHLGG